tara:strand:+ start:128 stop:442 length:315 start_codon:yes stop_codon:yes gene_type:complete
MKQSINGVLVDMTADEIAEYNALQTEYQNNLPNLKLKQIKKIRLQKLIETDYLANSDVTMPDNVKTWRQTLRDLPANHVDEAAYDALLARDADGKLTHSVWSKP